ncbi:hypothetical protein ACLB0R_01745 [Sphingomonas sp. GlSt437]|uniref:hypothetical protein n=1 Tax=Sphingomonas sp. GlSt437 TaxID=3389970 RepID=UPI003A87ECD6
MAVREKAPAWYWVATIILLLWALLGVAAFYAQIRLTKADIDAMPAYDAALLKSQPSWLVYDFALGTITGLVGALCLVIRSQIAMPLYLFSLIGVVIQFGWVLGATDIIAHKGLLAAAGFPLVIFVMAVFGYWLAIVARGRRWIS